MVPWVIVFDAAANGGPSLAQMLSAGGFEVCSTATTEALADALASRRHQVVLFALCPGRSDDLVALRLLRHLAPECPLIIVAADASLEVRRLIQTMRPIYFAARPVDGKELREAVQAACARQLRNTSTRAKPQPEPRRPGVRSRRGRQPV
jgi:DNA-binding NtrC family response regulator